MTLNLSRIARPVVALLCTFGAAAAGADEPVLAGWQARQVEFTYVGFTTHYTCDGLRGKVKSLMRHVGVRDDLKVSTSGCEFAPGEIARMPRVRIQFATPVPRESGDRTAGEPVPAQWKTVVIRRDQPKHLGLGDCELVEQFRDHVLPAFQLREQSGQITCIPHQLSGSRIDLRFTALVPLPSPDRLRKKPD